MPAPSPVLASQPHAPRCCRLMRTCEPLLDDRVRAAPLDVDDEADAAGVVLVAGVVQALGLRRGQMNRMSHGCVLVHSVYRLSASRS